MKVCSPYPTWSSRQCLRHNSPKTLIILSIAFVLLTITPLYLFPLLASSFTWKTLSPSASPSHYSSRSGDPRSGKRSCDISRGEWVPNPSAPYYNETCWAIHEHQNCIKYGRPDAGYMKWRWRPDECELPLFNPAQFLELVRGKTLAFVGDSVAGNHMQSLVCLLLRVTYAEVDSRIQDDKFRRYHFPTHNFTLASFWSPYLVSAREVDPNGPTQTGLFDLHLDEPDTNWTTKMNEFDYVIISAGHWFFRPAKFYEKGQLVGCQYCLIPNVTDLPKYYGCRVAFSTAFRFFNTMPDFKGTVILRTFAPGHFENGAWNAGGDCVRQRPFRRNETRLTGLHLEMYLAQMEEFRAAEIEGMKKGVKFWLLDTTEAMFHRPDGHPSRYGHLPDANVTMYNDCVHWCSPGPIDTWNDFLLYVMKSGGGRLATAGRLRIGQNSISK